MALIKCWLCEAEIDDTLKECPHCKMPVITFPGIKQEPPKAIKQEPQKEEKKPELCKKCGRPIPEDAAFCPKCGASVKAEVEQIEREEKESLVPATNETKNINSGTRQNLHAYAKKKHAEEQKKKGKWKKAAAIIVTLAVCVAFVGYLKVSVEPPKHDYASYSVSQSKSTSNSVSTGSSGGIKPGTLSSMYKAGKAEREAKEQDSGITAGTYSTYETNPSPTTTLTLGQENSLKTAKQYIAVMDFSYTGLVEQLEYEGYSHDDAVYGADNCGADWMAEAAGSAKSYMDVMSFSRQGLLDQLLHEGYTQEQAEHGVASVGY